MEMENNSKSKQESNRRSEWSHSDPGTPFWFYHIALATALVDAD